MSATTEIRRCGDLRPGGIKILGGANRSVDLGEPYLGHVTAKEPQLEHLRGHQGTLREPLTGQSGSDIVLHQQRGHSYCHGLYLVKWP
eukprot:scaffold45_cov33-Tisochrysis_lutea.AAC.1